MAWQTAQFYDADLKILKLRGLFSLEKSTLMKSLISTEMKTAASAAAFPICDKTGNFDNYKC